MILLLVVAGVMFVTLAALAIGLTLARLQRRPTRIDQIEGAAERVAGDPAERTGGKSESET